MVKIIEHDFVILDDLTMLDQFNGRAITKKIEQIARKCYKSEGLIAENTDLILNAKLRDNSHFAMIEHGHKISVLLLTDRGIGNESIRHRLTDFTQFGQGFGWDVVVLSPIGQSFTWDGNCSYAELSTRYCNFSKDQFGNEITIVRPSEVPYDSEDFRDWLEGCRKDEEIYMRRIKKGIKPQIARGNLPLNLRTEIVITTNITEWLHILDIRCSESAHPDMRRMMLRLLSEFHQKIPILFDLLYNKYKIQIIKAIDEFEAITKFLEGINRENAP